MPSQAPIVHAQNLAYVEELLARCRAQPESVPPEWREHFFITEDHGDNGAGRTGPLLPPRSLFNPGSAPLGADGHLPPSFDSRHAGLHERMLELIRNHRTLGHLLAAVDPLGAPRACPPELQLDYYGFTEGELNLLTGCATLPYDMPLTLREIFQRLRNTYSRSIGAEFMHMDDLAARRWLQQRMESTQNRLTLTREEQRRILSRLTDATLFEEFLRKKFAGAKTFSLEGSETLLPLLDLALEAAGTQGVGEVIFGMAHRGRLNVLANLLGKRACHIFREFAAAEPELWEGRGDVKHHLGHSTDWKTAGGATLHLSLCFNPSHLEFVNPVVLGRVRARQDRLGDRDRQRVLGVLIHGDAAFAGEGMVQETLNLSRLPAYRVGGVLHIVVNNQLGFTTAPVEGRSTRYATDVARMLQAPVFHVNGEDPEAVAQVVRLAMEFRQESQGDVFIDLQGYRRWGHNESDEPSFTQPLLYQAISRQRPVREEYLKHLLQLGGITAAEAEEIAGERRAALEADLAAAREDACRIEAEADGPWSRYVGGAEPTEAPDTGVAGERLAGCLRKLAAVPETFRLHPKLRPLLEARGRMADGGQPLDWGAAEALALASLATQGVRVRLEGQDSGRGTFSHRHAILHDQQDGFAWIPLQHVAPGQAPVEIVNSPLSEAGVLGFAYGYTLDQPDGLVIWEAQFGDFANAGQVVLDQFLASGEDKWRRLSALVLFLPHGFEGMGPEHSSARLERFLALAAEDNWQIVQPTTPAQLFHLLRRQALWCWRKPLVVFSPKSLLRHRQAVSPLAECVHGVFQRLIPDPDKGRGAQRVLLCSGKIYYELAAYRAERGPGDTAIFRLEQLYPLRDELLIGALATHGDEVAVTWVQEEPANMGAWPFLRTRFGDHLAGRFPLTVVSRPESASPATGSAATHKWEQARLIARAFGDPEPTAAEVLSERPRDAGPGMPETESPAGAEEG